MLALAAGAQPAALPSLASPEVRTLMDDGHWTRARAIVEPVCRSASRERRCDFIAWSRIQLAFGEAAGAQRAADTAIAIDPTRPASAQLARARAINALAADESKTYFDRRTLYGQAQSSYQRAVSISTSKLESIDPHAKKLNTHAFESLDALAVESLDALAVFFATTPRGFGGSDKLALEKADAIEPLDPVAADLTRATIFDWTTKRDEVRKLLDDAVAREPKAYRTTIAQATFEANFKQWPAAVQSAKLALAAHPSRIAPYNVLAVAYVHLNDLSALDDLIAKARREVPDDRSPEFFAARALISLNREPARARTYLDAYEAQPPEADAPSRHEAEQLRTALSAQTRVR